jgi:hypothetical protein
MSITFILNLFLMHTGCGMLFLCLFLPKDKIDRYIFKSICFFTWLFTGGGLFLRWLYPFTLPEHFGNALERTHYPYVNALYGAVIFVAVIVWVKTRFTNESPFKKWINLGSILAIIAVVWDSTLFIPQQMMIDVPVILVPIQFTTASLVLGGFLIGMIFGHWYLINTDMPKRLLVHMAVLLAITLFLKILAVALTWLIIRQTAPADSQWIELLTSFRGYGIFFWQRILIGLVIPAGIAYMIWSTARIGSNQSATGIMYVGVAFIFIGELVAKFLFLFSTIPL